MNDGSKQPRSAGAADAAAIPLMVDRATFEAELDGLRAREKAHTHEGDAIAAGPPTAPSGGDEPRHAISRAPRTSQPAGRVRRPTTTDRLLLHVARRPPGGRAVRRLHVGRHAGRGAVLPAFSRHHLCVLCQGPYDESIRYTTSWAGTCPGTQHKTHSTPSWSAATSTGCTLCATCGTANRVFETYWTTIRGVEAMDYSYALMDLTVYGRQEPWRTRPPAGHNSAPSRGPTAARPLGHQCQRGREDAPSPSGRASQLDALTTSPLGPKGLRRAPRSRLGPGASRPRRFRDRRHRREMSSGLSQAKLVTT